MVQGGRLRPARRARRSVHPARRRLRRRRPAQKVLDVYLNFRWNPERPGQHGPLALLRLLRRGSISNIRPISWRPRSARSAPRPCSGPDAATSLYRYDSLGRLQDDDRSDRPAQLHDVRQRRPEGRRHRRRRLGHRISLRRQRQPHQHHPLRHQDQRRRASVDANGNPTERSFASLRPAAHADDQWTFQVYDAAQRLIQTIDGTGATSVFSYDGASRLISTRSYANRLDSGTLAALKAEADATNFWTNANNAGNWGSDNLTIARGRNDRRRATRYQVLGRQRPTPGRGFGATAIRRRRRRHGLGHHLGEGGRLGDYGDVRPHGSDRLGRRRRWQRLRSSSGPGHAHPDGGGLFRITGLFDDGGDPRSPSRGGCTQAQTTRPISR